MTQSSAIPIIDIAPLVMGDEVGTEALVQSMRDGLQDSGFLYLKGHGISGAEIASIRNATKAFFAEPSTVRQAIAIDRNNRGYMAPGGARMAGAARSDLKEVFFFGRDLAVDDPDIRRGLALTAVNQWPEQPEGFRSSVNDYLAAVSRVGDMVLEAFALCLGVPRGFFKPFYDRPMARGQLIHYPPLPQDAPDDQFGVAAHSDFGAITLLMQETPGLEVLTRQGDWIAAPPIEGCFVINVGDLLERWTSGRLPSTKHRVRNTTSAGRYSIAVFYDPGPDAVIDPGALNAASAGSPLLQSDARDIEPIAAADYILSRSQSAFSQFKD